MSIARLMQMARAGNTSAAAPSFVGANSTSGSTTVSISAISDVQEGDIVFVSASDDILNFSMSSSGWTGMSLFFPNHVQSNSIKFLIGYKVMGSTPDTSVSVSTSVDTLSVAVFRDLSTENISSIWDVGGTATASSINLGSMSVSVENSVSLIFAYIDDDNTTIKTVPTGYSLATETGRLGGSAAILYKTELPSGTEDPGLIEWNSSDSLAAFGYIISP